MDLVLSHDGRLIAFFKNRPEGDFFKLGILSHAALYQDNRMPDEIEIVTIEKIFSNSSDISIWKLSSDINPYALDTKMFYLNDEGGRIFMALKMLKDNHSNIKFANITLPELFSYYGL